MTALLLGGPAAAGTNYALLIGTQSYPGIDPGSELAGPANDIERLSSYLVDDAPIPFHAGNVRILCCHADGENAATYANISSELRRIEGDAGQGDNVHIHFSGFGAQQPAQQGETDGIEEILLPADAGKWSQSEGSVANALRKSDLRLAVQRLRDKGAFVLLTVDASFASAAGPTVEGGEVVRSMDPQRLGISPDELAAAAVPARRGLVRRTPPLGIVGDGERGAVVITAAQAGEPTTEFEQNGLTQGLFTATLIDALGKKPGASFRQLTDSVIQAYAASARRRPTPGMEGFVDAVFSVRSESAIASDDTQRLNLALQVALPSAAEGLENLHRATLDAVSKLRREGVSRYVFVEPGAPADVRLVLLRDPSGSEPLLWLLPPSGELALEPGFRPPSLRLDEIGGSFGDFLQSIYRGAALARLARLSWSERTDLNVEYQIFRADSNVFEPLQEGETPVVRPGDQLHLKTVNQGDRAYDINTIYLASDHSLTHIHGERIHPGTSEEIPLLAFNDASFGREQLLTVVSEVGSLRPVDDFSFFDSWLTSESGIPSHGQSPVGRLLLAIATGEGGPVFDVGTDVAASSSVSARPFDVLP